MREIKDLRKMSDSELQNIYSQLRTELRDLRMKDKGGIPVTGDLIKKTRKRIARILTLQKERASK